MKPLPRHPLIISIDDGHRGNAELLPVIDRLGVPVTIFLCSSVVATTRHFWWTAVQDPKVREDLKKIPDEERITRLAQLGYTDTTEYRDRQALSKEEIESLKRVVDFQSHSRSHPVLPQCSGDRAVDEIVGSKAELEKRFSLSIYAFAYPNGDYNDRDIVLVKQAGYECALTLDGGYNTQHTDLFRLKRIPVYDGADTNELLVKASGLWDLLRKAFGWRPYEYRPSPSRLGNGKQTIRQTANG